MKARLPISPTTTLADDAAGESARESARPMAVIIARPSLRTARVHVRPGLAEAARSGRRRGPKPRSDAPRKAGGGPPADPSGPARPGRRRAAPDRRARAPGGGGGWARPP